MTEVKAAPEEVPLRFMVTEEMIDARAWRGQGPFFHVNGVAQIFFGMSASWLRLKLKADKNHPDTWFVLRGARMQFRRSDPDKSDSARVFTLADIEPMTWSLYKFGSIGPDRLARILRVVQAVAVLYGLLLPESEEENDENEGGET
jgi:hypothetical protein